MGKHYFFFINVTIKIFFFSLQIDTSFTILLFVKKYIFFGKEKKVLKDIKVQRARNDKQKNWTNYSKFRRYIIYEMIFFSVTFERTFRSELRLKIIKKKKKQNP